ncbi:hypothetical protein SLA2020_017140 [Shorea laevis]
MVWHYDKYERFSIKSAYLQALNVVHEYGWHSENTILSSGEWKYLWKLKVPPKIQVFLWRAIHNSLPSLENLMKRGILNEVLCPNCRTADETLMHLLFYCPHVEPIWFGSALGLDPRQLGVVNFVEWWRYINNFAKQIHLCFMVEHCAIICWHVWKAGNEKYYEHVDISPHQVLTHPHIPHDQRILFSNN